MIGEREGQQRERRRRFGGEERGPAAAVPLEGEAAQPAEMGKGEEGEEVGGEIDAREALQREGSSGEERIPHAVLGERAAAPEEHERQPPGGEHLDLAAVRLEAHRREAIEQPPHEGRPCLSREVMDQRGEGERIERRRGERREVVDEERVPGEQAQRREQQGEAEEVVGVQERPFVRVEDVRVE